MLVLLLREIRFPGKELGIGSLSFDEERKEIELNSKVPLVTDS